MTIGKWIGATISSFWMMITLSHGFAPGTAPRLERDSLGGTDDLPHAISIDGLRWF